MARLSWQNVDAPNLAPAMQGFANVTTLLQKALESASTNPMLENQIKQEELNAKIRKAKNDANTLAADRAINAKVAMSPSAQALQQSLQSGQLLGEDYLDATPEVISGARTAVGDMLTNSLNQDKVSALVPDRNLAWLELQYAGDPIGYQKALQSGQFLLPSTVNASTEAIRNLGTGLTTARTNYDNKYKQNQLEVTDANKKFATDLYGQISAMGLPKADQLNFMQSEAYRLGATPGQLGAMALLAKEQGLSNEPIVAPATTGKTGTTPAGTALNSASVPTVDYTGGRDFSFSSKLPNAENRAYAPKVLAGVGDLTGLSNKEKATALLPFIAKIENNDKMEGVSPKGAAGPTQVLPSTGADPGLGVKPMQNKSREEYYRFTTDYMEALLKRYNGNEEQALAAYNGGMKNVDKVIQQEKDNPTYGKTQVDNFKGRASRAIAQISADTLVANYTKLNGSLKSPDEVALEAIKTSVDFGTLNKDDMDSAARNIKRTILDIQERSGNTISADLAFEVAKQAFGDENFRTLGLARDLDLDDGKVDKILKGIKDKGGYADQARNLEKLNLGLAKLNAAEEKFNLAQQKLSEFSQRTTGNGYSEPARQKLEADRNLARERLSEITKTMQASGLYEPKENVTVEQKLDNAAEEKKALVDSINKTKLDLKAADDFVRTGKRTPASDAVAQSLQVTDPAQVKPVAAPIPVPIKVDGKSGTGTTFKVDTQTGKTVPVTPLKLDPNVKYEKPVTVVKADRSGGAKAILYYVGDGDGSNITLSQVDANNLNNGKTDLACRMDTIDADETTGPGKSWTIDQPNGIQARDYLRNLIASGSVTVIVTKPAAPKGEPKTSKNNYGRPLCKIEIEGVGIDMSMIKAGMATWYSQYSNDPALKAAEEKAKQDKVGRWKNPDVMNPADFRHGGWQQFLK
jgi:endonuclease YncB( thermonuclease family)